MTHKIYLDYYVPMTCPSWHFPIICLGLRISEPVVPCLAGSGWMWSVCHRATSRAFAIRRGISRALGPLAHDPWFCNCQGWCVNDKYLRLVRGRLTAHFRSKQTPPQTLVIRLKKSTSYPYVSHPLPRLWDLGHSAIPPRLKEDAAICSSPWVDPCWHRLQKVTIQTWEDAVGSERGSYCSILPREPTGLAIRQRYLPMTRVSGPLSWVKLKVLMCLMRVLCSVCDSVA